MKTGATTTAPPKRLRPPSTLTGANTYAGATTITAGTLALSGSGSIANSSGVSRDRGRILISQTTAGASISSATPPPDRDRLSRRATLTRAWTAFGGVIAEGIDNVAGCLRLGRRRPERTLTGVTRRTRATTISAGTLAPRGPAPCRAAYPQRDVRHRRTDQRRDDDHHSLRDSVTLGANTLNFERQQHIRRRHQRDRRPHLDGGHGETLGRKHQHRRDQRRRKVAVCIGSLADAAGQRRLQRDRPTRLDHEQRTDDGTVYARGTNNAPVVNNSVFNATGNLADDHVDQQPTAALNVPGPLRCPVSPISRA